MLELHQFPWRLVSLADSRTTAAQKDLIRESWENVSECCLPEGMARRLKANGIDVESAEMLSFLRWFARMARLTVADVEVRHARNNVSAGATGNIDFANIVAQYILAEYSELVRASVLSSAPPQRAAQSSAPPPPSSDLATGSKKRRSEGERLRGMNALQCFAADRGAQGLKTHGSFTKEFWAKLRSDFNGLPQERQAAYQAQAQVSTLRARDARAAAKAASFERSDTPATPSSRGAEAAPLAIEDSFNLNLLRGTFTPQLDAESMELVESGGDCLACFAEAQNCTDLYTAYKSGDNFEILRNLVDTKALDKFIGRQPVKTTASQFVADTRRVGKASGVEPFPAEVAYSSRCAAMCSCSDPEGHQMGLIVMKMLAACAKACSSPSLVPSAHMLLAFEARGSASRRTSFFWMLAASFQSGNHKATQTFWRCDPEDGGANLMGYDGLSLHVQRQELIRMQQSVAPPFNLQSSCPVFFDEEGVARAVAYGAGGKQELATTVVVRKLLFEELAPAPSVLRVLGTDDSFEPISDEHFRPQAKAKPKARPTPSHGDHPDFLSFLQDEHPRASTAKGRTGTKPSAPDALGNRTGRKLTGDAEGGAQAAIRRLQEDPLGDLAFLDGLAEALGDDVVQIVNNIKLDLEEDEAEQLGSIA